MLKGNVLQNDKGIITFLNVPLLLFVHLRAFTPKKVEEKWQQKKAQPFLNGKTAVYSVGYLSNVPLPDFFSSSLAVQFCYRVIDGDISKLLQRRNGSCP